VYSDGWTGSFSAYTRYSTEGKRAGRMRVVVSRVPWGGPNKTGPNLYGVIGAPYAHKDDYPYSDAFKAEHAKGRVWSMEDLFTYLKDPKAWVPGNKMGFAGLKKPDQRADVIAYLRTMNDNPPPLPAAPPAAAAAAPAAPK